MIVEVERGGVGKENKRWLGRWTEVKECNGKEWISKEGEGGRRRNYEGGGSCGGSGILEVHMEEMVDI